MVNNVNDVMLEFDSNAKKHLSLVRVLESNKTAFQKAIPEDGTIDEVRGDLEEWLTSQSRNPNNTNKYCIQFFKEYKQRGSKINGDGAIHCYLQFQPAPYTTNSLGYVQGIPNELTQTLKEIQDNQRLIFQKLEEEEEDQEPEQDPQGISGLLNSPEVRQMLVAGIGAILQKFLNPSEVVGEPGKLNGIELPQGDQFEKSKEAILLLSKKDPKFGDHLLYLANINTIQYNMLLSFMK